jgi:hypothetical protein
MESDALLGGLAQLVSRSKLIHWKVLHTHRGRRASLGANAGEGMELGMVAAVGDERE